MEPKRGEKRWEFAARQSGSTIAPRSTMATDGSARDPLRILRAFLAGAAATLADIAVLAVLVALVVGGVVNFLGNRHFAFRASSGSLAKQAALYTIVELAALAANGILFDVGMRLLPVNLAWAYVPVRLVTSHVVFLLWSYPLWRLVFRVPRPAQAV
jgi:putative flippase GtrA